MEKTTLAPHSLSTGHNKKREDAIVAEALAILSKRIQRCDIIAESPRATRDYLVCRFSANESEIFSIMWLDVKNHLIEHETLFHGTLTHCSVYPREIVKSALRLNAAGAILVHNHPSSKSPQPSEADMLLTRSIQQALALIETRVIDHIIVGGTLTHSFAEHGQI